jgi:anti-sigma B factor antagonist
VVTLPGEIDITNGGKVADMLAGALSDGLAVLVADATHTTFCAVSGMTALMEAHRQAQAAGTQLRVATSPAVLRLLQLTRAEQVLHTYPTLANALNGHRQASGPEVA